MRTRPAHRALRLQPLTPRAIRIIAAHLHIRAIRRATTPTRSDPRSQRLACKPSLHAGSPLRQPEPSPDQALDDAKHNDGAHGDADDVGGRDGGALGLDVEKGVRVEAFGVVRDVGHGEVQGQDEDDPPGVDPERRGGAGHDDLEEGEERVHGVLRNVAEGVEFVREPHAREDDAPVDGRHDKRVGGDGGVVKGVEGLQGPGEPVEQRFAGAGVGEGVDGGGEVVEGEAPVGEDGEVGEFVAGGGTAAPVGGVGALPA